MGYVYFIRHGFDDEFKIGKTGNVQRRLKSLQTGSPKTLTLFDAIDTADPAEGEAYLHRLLAHRQLVGENFRLSPPEAREAAAKTRTYLQDELPRVRKQQELLAELDSAECTGEVLSPTQEILDAHHRILELEDEASALREKIAEQQHALEDLETEQLRLENFIKLAIGYAKAIDGVAIWETTDGRRRIDPEWVKADDPQMYEKYVSYVEKFDAARYKKEMPAAYEAHQRITRVRLFQLVMPAPGA